jgi:hypothetical protein
VAKIDLTKAAPLLGKGLLSQLAPQVVKGALVELFGKKIDFDGLVDYVRNDVNLWGKIEPEKQLQLKNLARKIGRLNWLTPQYVIDALRKDQPAIASLFTGWRKASNWLERQIANVKSHLTDDIMDE